MCSQVGDTANNSLQLETTRGTVMHVNPFPPTVEVLGGNVPVILNGAGGTDINEVVIPQINHPALTHGYFKWFQNKSRDITAKAVAG